MVRAGARTTERSSFNFLDVSKGCGAGGRLPQCDCIIDPGEGLGAAVGDLALSRMEAVFLTSAMRNSHNVLVLEEEVGGEKSSR